MEVGSLITIPDNTWKIDESFRKKYKFLYCSRICCFQYETCKYLSDFSSKLMHAALSPNVNQSLFHSIHYILNHRFLLFL